MMNLRTRDPLNAFLDYPETKVASAAQGPLAGLTLGVKDIFDVAGYPTGGGNPAKLAESPIAAESASAVKALLDAGAGFTGKTQTEELAFSMIGMNAHFPSPVNVRAPQRVTGGSSSGSAAAVAGGLADIALGSDTNGSIRAPASFCGLIGLRTTWGRIAIDRTMPLAPSFDTVGWFTRDAATYEKVGELLLGPDPHGTRLVRPVRAAELEALLFGEAECGVYNDMLRKVLARFDPPANRIAMPGTPEAIYDCFKLIQSYEAWRANRDFLSGGDRRLGPGIKERFDYARGIGREEVEAARRMRREMADAFAALFEDDMVLILPSQPSAAPLKSSNQEELQRYRDRALTLTSFAGFLGWPQISIPLGVVHEAPFGISLLGPAGSDRQLINIAADILGA